MTGRPSRVAALTDAAEAITARSDALARDALTAMRAEIPDAYGLALRRGAPGPRRR